MPGIHIPKHSDFAGMELGLGFKKNSCSDSDVWSPYSIVILLFTQQIVIEPLYVPSSVLGHWDKAVNKTGKKPLTLIV